MVIGGIFYEWVENFFFVSDVSIGNFIVSLEDSIIYMVMIIDINGCVMVDDVIVLVVNDFVMSIMFYNLIIFNGDGFNDELEFGEISKFGFNLFKVYNCWGDFVY